MPMPLCEFRCRSLPVAQALLLGPALLLFSQFGAAAGLDSRTAIERAVLQIELGDTALARSYLTRPLIDPRITAGERSRAYYLQGYSLELSDHHVSAAQNYARALAFNEDNPATLAALGNLYARGLGVDKDKEQAIDLLRRSAQQGHAPGMTALGALLLAGLANSPQPQKDLDEARALLASATEVNDGKAFLFLAQSYRASHTATPDPQKALDLYQQALVLNQGAAFNSIGNMHLSGELGEPNTDAALAAFNRGVTAQDGPAMVSLGYLHLTGTHVPKELETAQSLFQQAAALGETKAHHYLGYIAEGNDAEQQAIEHYKAAAAVDYPPALKRLSELYFANTQPAAGLSYLRAFVAATKLDAQESDPSKAVPHWRATHLLAWLLATHQEPDLRDGDAALRYAKACVANKRSAATLDTLAAAYAEARDFTAAVTTQSEALNLLEPTENAKAARLDYSQRLAAYEQRTPWREATVAPN